MCAADPKLIPKDCHRGYRVEQAEMTRQPTTAKLEVSRSLPQVLAAGRTSKIERLSEIWIEGSRDALFRHHRAAIRIAIIPDVGPSFLKISMWRNWSGQNRLKMSTIPGAM